MAKTLKQILDGTKSSKIKTKDILGTKPGVDYSPKAGDERKFADKHHIEKHADRVGNGDDVYNATNVKSYMDTDKAERHGYKAGEDEKVYEDTVEEAYGAPEEANRYPDSPSSHDSHANFHARVARAHAIHAMTYTKTKENDKAKKHQAAAEAHHAADIAHSIAAHHHGSGHMGRHDSSIAAHKASKEANKLADIANNIFRVKHFKEELDYNPEMKKAIITAHKNSDGSPKKFMDHLIKNHGILKPGAKKIYDSVKGTLNFNEEAVDEAAKCNHTKAGVKCPVHGMKSCIKEDDTPSANAPPGQGATDTSTSTQNNLKALDLMLNGDQPRRGKCNMTEAGKMCEMHGMKQCPSSNKKVLNEKPPVKEEVVNELLVQNYVSGSKGKSAEVHKNMNAGTYSVKKMVGNKLVSSSEHDDSTSAHAAAKKHLGEDLDPYNPKDTGFDFKYGGQHKGRRAEVHRMPGGHYEVRKYKNPKFDLGTGEHVETVKHTDRVKAGIEAQNFANMKEEVELDEKAAVAKSKQTMLVTAKGSKSAGGVMRIKKSEYDPKKHDLAEGDLEERKMTGAEMDKREHIVKGMKKKLSDFRARYGKRAKDVMYATATKQAMKEDLAQPLIGSMDPTGKKKKKENEQTAPAVTPITLPNYSVDVNTGRNV